MIRTTIIQEVGLEDRLKPIVNKEEEICPTAYQSCKKSFENGMIHSKLTCSLLRSPSLERLMQFPSYLCTKGSYDFKLWLENSRTSLSNSINRSLKLAHEFLFNVLVYCIILAILIQVCLVLNLLIFHTVFFTGATFLYVTTSLLGAIMALALTHTDKSIYMKHHSPQKAQEEQMASTEKAE